MFWENSDAFLSYADCHVVEDCIYDESDAYTKNIRRTKVVKIGSEIYSITIIQKSGCEEDVYSEEWLKNGVFHRSGNLPAVITYGCSFIPGQNEVDYSDERFYENGNFLK